MWKGLQKFKNRWDVMIKNLLLHVVIGTIVIIGDKFINESILICYKFFSHDPGKFVEFSFSTMSRNSNCWLLLISNPLPLNQLRNRISNVSSASVCYHHIFFLYFTDFIIGYLDVLNYINIIFSTWKLLWKPLFPPFSLIHIFVIFKWTCGIT